MNTLKTSTALIRFTAACAMVCAVGVSAPVLAADAKAPVTDAKTKTVTKTAKAESKALRRKTKLPRKWVWKKYAKNFDSMFRK